MALTDVHAQSGEGMDFIVEVPTGTLNAPVDILIETNGSQYPLLETPLVTGGSGNVFIMSI
jgi:hypothetical protein